MFSGRLEKEVDRKTESLTVLTEKSKAAEAKVSRLRYRIIEVCESESKQITNTMFCVCLFNVVLIKIH